MPVRALHGVVYKRALVQAPQGLPARVCAEPVVGEHSIGRAMVKVMLEQMHIDTGHLPPEMQHMIAVQVST